MHAGMCFFSCLTVSSREMAIRRDDKLLLETEEGLFFNLDENLDLSHSLLPLKTRVSSKLNEWLCLLLLSFF